MRARALCDFPWNSLPLAQNGNSLAQLTRGLAAAVTNPLDEFRKEASEAVGSSNILSPPTDAGGPPPVDASSSSDPPSAPSLAYAVSRPLSSMGMKSLESFGKDLTAEARKGNLDPVFGRDREVERLVGILMRRTKNNPVLIGEPGVGKTACVEAVAQLIASPQCPKGLELCRIVSLDVGALVAGTQYRGAFEERLSAIIEETRKGLGTIILFVDELHMLLSAGQVEGGLTAANLLKPALARGELRMIGATTTAEYREHVESDSAFARRFSTVLVEEPSPEDAERCLGLLQPRYEAHHDVEFGADALRTAVQCASRYMTDRRLPDSAIDLLDEACSLARLEAARRGPEAVATSPSTQAAASESTSTTAPEFYVPPAVSLIGQDEVKRRRQAEAAGSSVAWDRDRPCPHCGYAVPFQGEDVTTLRCSRCSHSFLNIDPMKLIKGVTVLQPATPTPPQQPLTSQSSSSSSSSSAPQPQPTQPIRPTAAAPEPTPSPPTPPPSSSGKLRVERRHVLEVATRSTGIPLDDLAESEAARLAHLEALLDQEVIGQPQATHAVASAVRLARLGLSTSSSGVDFLRTSSGVLQQKKTAASFLFHGPIGVGKSLLARALGFHVFGSANHVLRIDMSEYTSGASLSKLIGAPPGYVGFGKGGVLSDFIRTHPFSLLQLESINKAHPDVQSLLAQIVDQGMFLDSMGRKCNAANAIIIMTVDEATTSAPAPAEGGASLSRASMHPHTDPRHHSHVVTNAHGSGRDGVVPEKPTGASAFHAGAMSLDEDSARASVSSEPPSGVNSALRRVPQELWSRVTAVVQFKPLEREDQSRIVRQHVDSLVTQLRLATQADIEVRRETVDKLVQNWLSTSASAHGAAQGISEFVRRTILTEDVQRLITAGGSQAKKLVL